MKFTLSTSLLALLAAPLVSAIPPPTKTFVGNMRYFTPGLGSCGKTNTTAQMVVALSATLMKNGPNPNTNPKCGHIVTISHKGKSAKGMIVDTCPTCATDDINVSPVLFEKFAPESQGVVDGVTWHFNS